MTINYEWDIELVDSESMDVLDHNHASNLKEIARYKTVKPDQGEFYSLVLVRDDWREDGQLMTRDWWYPDLDEEPILDCDGLFASGGLWIHDVSYWKFKGLTIRNAKQDGSLVYGATWSGQIDILVSIVNPVVIKDDKGVDKVIPAPASIIWDAMTLQDAIDFSIYAIRTTIDTMRFQARRKNVGGTIDVLLLTPDEVRWICRKELHN